MQKLIIEKPDGMVQVTSDDERWYAIPSSDPATNLPMYRFIPSVTWICSYYPKGVAFYKWLASKGWDEAQEQKNAAGDKGSRIHKAIEDLISGETVSMDSKYTDNSGFESELTTEEYEAVLSFVDWAKSVNPTFLHTEMTVISNTFGFAGTVDCIAKIGDDTFIIDWKSSQNVWPEMELQISAYKTALIEMGILDDSTKLAILQVGYRKNRNRYKWNEVEYQFPLFLAARTIWEKETSGDKPLQRDYPVSVSLNLKVDGRRKARKLTQSKA
jgi:hypothetical protein